MVGVVTQGLDQDALQWVTEFKISFGNSTDVMQIITKENGSDKVGVCNQWYA